MEENGRWITTKYGARVFIKEQNKTNKYMNEKIKKGASKKTYIKYDDDEQILKLDNPDIVLEETNDVIKEWTSDVGGYRSNYGIQKYLTEDKDAWGIHEGWEKGAKDIDKQITGKLSKPITTYRTVQIPVKELNVGDVVDEKGFIATSINRSYSYGAFNHGDWASSTIEVKVEPGTRCLYIGDKTGHINPQTGQPKNEYELLFPQEYQIEIIDKTVDYDEDGDYISTKFIGRMNKRS